MRRSAQVAASEQVEERLTKALADVAELRTLLAARDRQIEHLTKMLFARQSERIADDKAPKAAVGLGRVNAAATAARRRSADEECEEIAYKRKKRGATRVSKDLPRETQMLALPEAERLFVLQRGDVQDRRRGQRAARLHAGGTEGDRDQAREVRLPLEWEAYARLRVPASPRWPAHHRATASVGHEGPPARPRRAQGPPRPPPPTTIHPECVNENETPRERD
jgi:hypothetical protein